MSQYQNNRISISSDFLKAFADIPQAQQKKIREFVQQFQSNPEMPGGRHYEQLQKACDSALRSIRVDQTYRAIVAKPEGNVFILLWVDKHDEAYHWAERKKLKIHPYTGALQIINIQEKDELVDKSHSKGIFDAFLDQQLLSFGIPEDLIPIVHKIKNEDDLLSKESLFPQEAYNVLFMLACGEKYDEVLAEYNRTERNDIDTTDYWSALDNADSQSRFAVVENGVDLEALLNSPLEQWRVFLHPLQRKIVETNASGPMRVLGIAGTGKTVVAMHRAKYLLENVFVNSTDRILFTTFTKNLATDIFHGLQQICSPDILKRIDVINLDAWTHNLLENYNYRFKVIEYEPETQKKLWEQALTFKPAGYSDQFFLDEWNQVIQPQDVINLDQYLKASRTGRGRRLNRLERKKLWPVWEEYRALLNEGNFREIQDIYRDASILLKQKNNQQYRSVIVDEAQDFSEQAFLLIRAILPEQRNDIFVVGDAHQRIYGHPISLAKCGIKIVGRSKKLKVNYRTTAQTYRFAASILKGLSFDDLDGQEDPLGNCQSITSGPEPSKNLFSDFEEEKNQIYLLIKKLKSNNVPLDSICLTSRTNDLLDKYFEFLTKKGILCHKITSRNSSKPEKNSVHLATMHRVKGIEFDYVILASMCDDIVPPKHLLDLQENEVDKQKVLIRERALCYVALTRARREAFITGYGVLSSII